MLKQQKKINKTERIFKQKKKINFRRSLLRKLKDYNNTTYVYLNESLSEVHNRINVKITSNNIFCTLSNLKTKKTLLIASAGKYKIKTSKRTLKFSFKIIFENFLKEIKNKILDNKLIFVITAPKRIRRRLIKQIKFFFKFFKKHFIIHFKDKKCFNGCRPAKKKRKKRKGFRIFK